MSDITSELKRVQEAIKRCKSVEDHAKRGRVDQGAAKRMITSGLWKPGDDKIKNKGSAEFLNFDLGLFILLIIFL